MKTYVKFSAYELVFQRFPINLISENPWKLMFGIKNMHTHRGYLLVKIAARYLILFSSYLKTVTLMNFLDDPYFYIKKKIYFGFSEI